MGPLLFLVMIRDIDEHTSDAMVGIFADDTRLWRVFRGEEDSQILQDELKKAYRWANDNNATYNNDKFEAVRFQKQPPPEELDPVYLANNNTGINFKPHVKDLGIWMAASLNFK